MRRIIIIISALVFAGFGVCWYCLASGGGQAAAEPPRTAKAERGCIEVTVEATGPVESNLDVDIKSKASGEIVSLPYDVGQKVARHVPGANDEKTLLVALDPTDEQRRVERAGAACDVAKAQLDQAMQAMAIAKENLRTGALSSQAAVARAEAKLEMDKLTVRRHEELRKTGGATQNELDLARTEQKLSQAGLDDALASREALKGLELAIAQRQADVELAQANLKGLQVELADARQRLADTKVYCPIDGVVTRRCVETGQIISSGIQNIAGGTTLLTVSDLSRIFVVAAVDESDIGRLIDTGQPASGGSAMPSGQQASVTVDAYPGRQFPGKVVQITPRGVSEANVVTFAVKIEVTGPEKALLLPKMTANVKISACSRKDVLTVPLSAVQYRQGKGHVTVWQDGKAATKQIITGMSDGVVVEVLDGLREGQMVLTGSSQSRWINQSRTGQPATDRDGGK
ncbi:MAG: efflux RND transporter periplasmic adaptor subunit [Planctomycetes bacterium]|nr:efflux RND transporter periplasmic adaptor subunit [Planctomycetota bacterium]